MKDLLWKTYYSVLVRPFLERRLRYPLSFQWNELKLKIDPGVFHPGYFFSSTFFGEYLSEQNLKGKLFCDVGTGSGFLGLIAYRSGAKVTCLDVHPAAIRNASENFGRCFPQADNVQLLESDLFDRVPPKRFDVIAINPPYFFSDPRSDSAKAWYCGENGAYFQKLFEQLHDRVQDHTVVLMCLAENCEIERIRAMSDERGFRMELVKQKKIKWELNYIFRIVKK